MDYARTGVMNTDKEFKLYNVRKEATNAQAPQALSKPQKETQSRSQDLHRSKSFSTGRHARETRPKCASGNLYQLGRLLVMTADKDNRTSQVC